MSEVWGHAQARPAFFQGFPYEGHDGPPGLLYHLIVMWEADPVSSPEQDEWATFSAEGITVTAVPPNQQYGSFEASIGASPDPEAHFAYPMVRRAGHLYGYYDPDTDPYHPAATGNTGLDTDYTYLTDPWVFEVGDRVEAWAATTNDYLSLWFSAMWIDIYTSSPPAVLPVVGMMRPYLGPPPE